MADHKEESKKILISVVVLLLAILGVCIFFLINNHRTNKIDQDQIEALKFQRDSIIIYNTAVSKEKEASFKNYADSLVNYNQYYIKADSINKITIYNAKKQLKYLTRAGRDRVRDSLFRANNLPNSPR